MDNNDKLDRAKRIALQQVQSLKNSGISAISTAKGRFDFGFEVFDEAETATQDAEKADATKSPVKQMAGIKETKSSFAHESENPTTEFQSQVLALPQRQEQMAILDEQVAGCTRCSELATCRTNTVFGVGNLRPQLCFLGEGPGADEDRQGEPFVGQAGKLLNKIIEACKMSRDDVYILNTVKCRPPANRNPNESELENCWPFAVQQLEILQPEFICCLGSVAARTLLKTKQSIGKMRGQFFRFRGSQVVVTYHPAYLLRNPSAKRQVWDDMKMLLTAMGRDL